MLRIRRSLFCAVILLFICGTSAFNLLAGELITAVATSNATGGAGLSIPSINNNGTVAFVSRSAQSGTLFTGGSGPLTPVITSTTLFIDYGSGPASSPVLGAAPSINNAGTVTFWGASAIANEYLIESGSQGAINSVVSGSGPVGTTGMTFYTNSPQTSDSGTTVFAAYRVGGFPGGGVFKGQNGTLTPLASTDTEIHTAIDPAISSNDTIAYEWSTLNQFGNPAGDNIYRVVNGVTTPIVSTDGSFFKYIAVNDGGTVALSSDHLIQVGSGGPLTTIANTLGSYSLFEQVSINSSNEVVFYSNLAAGGAGIFNGPDPVLNKVIAVGDSLLGSTVTDLAFGRDGLNDGGQVAFWARLADGEEGVFVATAVPEPGTEVIMLSGAGILVLAARRVRRAR